MRVSCCGRMWNRWWLQGDEVHNVSSFVQAKIGRKGNVESDPAEIIYRVTKGGETRMTMKSVIALLLSCCCSDKETEVR